MKGGVGEFLARKLSRVTSTGEYIPEIDGLRCLAIVPVMLVHATTAYVMDCNPVASPGLGWASRLGYVIMKIFAHGWSGVQIFFVLSGFVLGIPFARQYIVHSDRVSIRRYLLRRVTRIEPPYIICLTAFWLVFYHHHLTPHYIAGLFYLHQIVYHAYNSILIPAWSLEVEVEFYLLAPLLCTLFAVRPAWLRRSVLAAVTLLYSYWVTRYLPHHTAIDRTLLAELQYFIAGFLLADLYLCGWFPRVRNVGWDIVAAGASLALLESTVNGEWTSLRPLFISLIFVAAFRGFLFASFVRIRAVTIFGGMCYSIYLWHTVPTYWRLDRVEHLPFPIGFFATVVSYVLLGILVSIPMFVLVEKPFMGGNGSRLLERFLRRLTGRTAAAQERAGSSSALR